MKKLFILLVLALFALAVTAQDSKPVSPNFKQIPSPGWWWYDTDSVPYLYRGNGNWVELMRANKKYSIWNHLGISNTGWTPSKVLGFDVDGNLVPVAAGSGSMVYPGAGIAVSNGSGWATSLTDNSATWNKAIYSDATFSAANYLLKTADTGRKATEGILYDNGTYIGLGTTSPSHYVDIRKTLNSRTNYGLNVSMTASTLQSDVTSTGNDENLINQYYAWKFTANGAHTVGSWGVRLKKTGTVTNTTDYIRIRLYSDNAGVPNTLLATSDQVKMGTITTSYVEYLFGFDYTLVNGTTYWIAVERSAAVTGGGTISVDRNATALTTASVSSPTSGDWTVNAGLGRYNLYGQSPCGGYFSSVNSHGVQSISTNLYGVYGSSINSYGGYFTSTNSFGIRGDSNNEVAIRGLSINSYGGYFTSTNSFGVYGFSTNAAGLQGNSTNSYGAIFYQSGALTQNNSSNTVLIRRYPSGSYNVTGNVLQLTDNPTVSGIISGAIISAQIDATERLRFDPRVVDGSSAVASFEDTRNSLSNANAKLKSWRNNGTEKAYILADGSFYSANNITSSTLKVSTNAATGRMLYSSDANGNLSYTNTPADGQVMKFTGGVPTWSAESAMVYPGAGLAKSTGSGWATSITDNSANWNTAYGWGNHASQGYVNSILINGTSGENAGGFLDFIPGSGINITKTGGHVTIAATGGSMVYPGAGIPVSTGSAWGTSIADNSSNWNTAYSNRIATFTTTGNSGAATFSGNTLNIPTYTLAGLGGQPTVGANVSFGYNGNWVALDGSLVRYSNTILQRFADIGGGTYVGSTFPSASTTEAGLMSATDKTNLDAAVSNSGKVKLFGTSTWGELSANYFEWSTNSFRPIRDGSPQENSLYPITSGGVYTALLAKANLSGATFTGAISSTSTMTATDFILSSDRRLKSHIKPIQNLDWTNKVKWKQFHIKEDPEQRLHYGVLAQDIELIAPHLVYEDSVTHKKSVAYIDLLIAKIADLENRIKALENEK